jgi:cephalosporin hydroxylase
MPSRREIVGAFDRVYYADRAFSRLTWRGVPTIKYPTDLLVYAELLWQVRPQIVVETGTYMGGTALFLADHLDLIGDGLVVTIDVNDWSTRTGLPQHDRIEYVRGSSTSPAVVAAVHSIVGAQTCLVVLDSAHSCEHVLAELDAYSPLVSVGSYLIVEDTNVHDVQESYPPGPDDAVAKWLPDHPEFVVDEQCEKLLLTAAPGGFLRRVR